MSKYLLIVDPSGSHLAYALAEVNGKEFMFHSVGMLWTKDKWNLGQRLDYMYRGLKTLMLHKHTPVDEVYTEAFFVNKFKMSGTSVIPTINNMMQMIIHQVDARITFQEISPTSWRKVLNIKAIVNTDGSKDYKTPTADVVKSTVGQIPDEIVSNVTGKTRAVPHDVTDVMAIALSVAKNLGCTQYEMSSYCFNNPILLRELQKLNEG